MAAHSKLNSRSPTQWQRISNRTQVLLRQSIKTSHHRIVTCGFLIGLCYLPTWLGVLWHATADGSSTPLLNLVFGYLGLETLWKQRHQLATLPASDEERFVGHLLILGGAVAFLFCFSSISQQAFIGVLILMGMLYSSWGFACLKRCWLAIVLLISSLYPDWVFLSNLLWRVVTPPDLIESFMAWSGSLALQAVGQAAVAQGPFLSLPNGAVQVASGCSGFDMAFMIVGASLALGLFLHQSWLKIAIVATIGAVLALSFNVPRIMVLAMAAVYWGKDSFEFWHGPIGGQIFSCILLTVYYYVAMFLFKRRPVK